MPGTNTAALPITVFKVKGNSDAMPQTRRLAEGATQTFFFGVPVVVTAGYLVVSPTLSSALTIAGFSQEAGHNLTTNGVAPFGGSGLKYGNVPNQPNAVNIPIGAPMSDGTCGVNIADENTIFDGVVDAAHTPAVTDIGVIYGLTLDSASGQWFVDTTITSAASGAIVEVTDIITTVPGGMVGFRITKAGQQFGI